MFYFISKREEFSFCALKYVNNIFVYNTSIDTNKSGYIHDMGFLSSQSFI